MLFILFVHQTIIKVMPVFQNRQGEDSVLLIA